MPVRKPLANKLARKPVGRLATAEDKERVRMLERHLAQMKAGKVNMGKQRAPTHEDRETARMLERFMIEGRNKKRGKGFTKTLARVQKERNGRLADL
ncbi:MAG: hypothetical protein AABW59_02305 [archaeon]